MIGELILHNNSRETPDDNLDYFKFVNIEGTRNSDSERTYRTMMKYVQLLTCNIHENHKVNSKDISDFVRKLHFIEGLKRKPLSRKYINNILFTVIPHLRIHNMIDSDFKLDLKTLWRNVAKERRLREKNNLDAMTRRDRFEALNPSATSGKIKNTLEPASFFVLTDESASILINECKRSMMINSADKIDIFSDEIQCCTALLLAFATGARTVANILTLTFDEINLLMNTGNVICQGKHMNRCSIYIVPNARIVYGDFFQRGIQQNRTDGSRLWFTIRKKKFRSWYKRLIYRLFKLPLKKGRVLHEIRTWLIGRVNDKVGLRAAAKTVSHTRLNTTSKYVDRSLGNIDAISVLDKSFKNFTF